MTRHLLRRTDELHAVELDKSLVGQLGRKFVDEPKLQIHQGDVLETDLAHWGPAVIVGNLPYYITSPIIEQFLALDDRFPSAVFLTQLEVAQRLVAQPGTRDYGYLTVATRLRCDVEMVLKVAPDAFHPPPKVDSAAVRLVRKPNPTTDVDGFLKMVSRAFVHKRKTLRNNLKAFYDGKIERLPEANQRAEQLSVQAFENLYRSLNETGLQ